MWLLHTDWKIKEERLEGESARRNPASQKWKQILLILAPTVPQDGVSTITQPFCRNRNVFFLLSKLHFLDEPEKSGISGPRIVFFSLETHRHIYACEGIHVLLTGLKYFFRFNYLWSGLWRPKKNFQELLLSFYLWVLESEVESSDMVMSSFTELSWRLLS